MRLLLSIAGILLLSVALAVAYPDVMIKPGELSSGHRGLDRDCFACHSPLQGASREDCLGCHKLDRIGRVTTSGQPLPAARLGKLRFHAGLGETDCLRCHTVHASVRHRRATAFQHTLLAPAVRGDCRSCHSADKPADSLHARVGDACGACHDPSTWKTAAFHHSAVVPGTGCIACHQKNRPVDELHPNVTSDCLQCHSTKGWLPASFDHNRYFRFDANHPADCRTCHTRQGTFSTYSCYGCHEHSPDRLLAEHQEEGVRNIEGCARCHRSGQDGEIEGGGERSRGEEEEEDD